MKRLLLLSLVILCLGTSKAQRRESFCDTVRGLINDSLFSHFHEGADSKQLFAAASVHHEFVARENKIDDFVVLFSIKSGEGRGATEELIRDVIVGAKKSGTVMTEIGIDKFSGLVIKVYTHNAIKVVVDEIF